MPGRILLADQDAEARTLLRLKLSMACYKVNEAENYPELLSLANSHKPDVIILSTQLIDIDGYTACKRLKDHNDLRNIPVVMILNPGDPDERVNSLECGADDYLVRPVDELILLARVRSLRKAATKLNELQLRCATSQALGFAEEQTSFERPGNVGLVSTHTVQLESWKNQLSRPLGGRVRSFDPEEALSLSSADQIPDVFVISGDLRRPSEGLRILSELRSGRATRHAAFIMIFSPGAQQDAVVALDVGAADLMYEGFAPRELVLRVTAQIRRKQNADRLRKVGENERELANIDTLSGLYNRRYALAHLKRSAKNAIAVGRCIAVMMVDIDHFKSVNDRYGHAAGDLVIKEVATRLKQHLRAEDLLARIGGEEFLVSLCDTSAEQAEYVAERLRHAVECAPVESGDLQINVTISLGLTVTDTEADTDDLLLRADRALYRAKNAGRNRVVHTSESILGAAVNRLSSAARDVPNDPHKPPFLHRSDQ